MARSAPTPPAEAPEPPPAPERTRSPLRGLTAAGRRLDTTDRKQVDAAARPARAWQQRAYDLYESDNSDLTLGELGYAANWTGDALSKLRVIPAVRQPGEAQPVPVDQAEGIAPDDVDAAYAAVGRLDTAEGGWSEILGALGLNDFLTGEAYVVGRVVDNVERWEVFSVESIVRDDRNNLCIKPTPDANSDALIVLDSDAWVLHIMRRSRRWPGVPYTPLKSALPYCDDLLLLNAMVQATAMSRLPADVLLLPEGVSAAGPHDDDPTVDEQQSDDVDDVLEQIMKHFTTPVSNRRDPASIVPFLLRMDPEDIQHVDKVSFSRDMDRLAIELRDEVRRAFASSVDLPPEILVGKADLNHWTAYSIPEDAFNWHIEPRAVSLLGALTSAYYRPTLDAMMVTDPGVHLLWYDASGLVSRTDHPERVTEAYDRGEASGDYYCDVLGIPEDARTDDAEIERRTRLAAISTVARSAKPGEQGPASEPGAAPPSAVTSSASPSSTVDMLVATATRPADVLGLRLARIEQSLRERLRVAADADMRRALERAGNRLRTAVSRQHEDSSPVVAAARAAPAWLVASHLGPSLVAAMNLTDDDLLDGAFDGLQRRWDEWVTQAQAQARAAIADAGGEFDDAEWQRRQDDDRAEGWAVLAAALAALAAARLYEPQVVAPDRGEFDSTTLVPPGVIRTALTVAGGGPSSSAPVLLPSGADTAGGLLSGETIAALLVQAAGLTFGSGYVWLYGDPSSRTTPFDAHLDLDGVEFARWDDPVLANPEGWPPVEFLYPGDHEWCQCEAARLMVGVESDDDAPADATVGAD